MIHAHANAGSVQHELGHSIHSYYWDGDMTSGSGGLHNLTDCYDNGLALSEGFANLLTYWVQFEPTADNPNVTAYNFTIDTLGSNFCSGASNEVRVATTLWDTYDIVKDGTAPARDSWNFSKPWVPVSILLKNKGPDSILEFMGIYATILGDDWALPIYNLFLLNTTVLP